MPETTSDYLNSSFGIWKTVVNDDEAKIESFTHIKKGVRFLFRPFTICSERMLCQP